MLKLTNITIKLNNNLVTKKPESYVKSKVPKVSKAAAKSTASTTQTSNVQQDQAQPLVPMNFDFNQLLQQWGQFVKTPQGMNAGNLIPFPVLIPHQQGMFKNINVEILPAEKDSTPDDPADMVGNLQFHNVANVSGGGGMPNQFDEVHTVDTHQELPQQDVEVDSQCHQVIMEIDLEDQPLPPPPGWPKLTVGVASTLQSALELVQQDSVAGKQVCIILAKHVPLAICHLIWVDNYVDLLLLLDKDVSAEQPLQFVTKNGKLALVKAPVGNKIDSWGQWNKAICFFTEIYAVKYPFKCMQLVQYAGLLNNLAGKFPFYQVYNYDKEFRRELEQVPGLQWNKIDQQLWSTCLHGVNIMSQNQPRGQQQPQQQRRQQQQLDWPFQHCFTHSRGGCNHSSCKFPPICG